MSSVHNNAHRQVHGHRQDGRDHGEDDKKRARDPQHIRKVDVAVSDQYRVEQQHAKRSQKISQQQFRPMYLFGTNTALKERL